MRNHCLLIFLISGTELESSPSRFVFCRFVCLILFFHVFNNCLIVLSVRKLHIFKHETCHGEIKLVSLLHLLFDLFAELRQLCCATTADAFIASLGRIATFLRGAATSA